MRVLSFVFVAFLSVIAFSQEKRFDEVHFKLDKITVKEKFRGDSSELQWQKEQAIKEFAIAGYQGISQRDSIFEDNKLIYHFSFENRFKSIHLSEENSITSGFKDYSKAQEEIARKLTDLENKGFPFASIKFNKDSIHEDQLYLQYELDSGTLFIIDKIVIKSNKKVNENTISSLINIQVGDIYSELRIRKIGPSLQLSGFYSLTQSPQVIFREGKAEIYLFLNQKKSSAVDGYVGLQQDQLTSRLALNGYINLSLKNAFKRATILDLNWRNNPDKSQLLKVYFDFPYLFKTPLGVGSKINLQKQDTSFTRSLVNIYLGYRNPQFNASVFSEFEQSSLLVASIPNFRSFNKNTYGLNLRYAPLLEGNYTFFSTLFRT